MFLKKRPILFAVFIIILFSWMTYQSLHGPSRFFNFLLTPINLVQKAGYNVYDGARGIIQDYIFLVGVREENKKLKAHIARLESEKNSCIEATYENTNLKKLLGLKDNKTIYVTSATVIARDQTNWFNSVFIDKGSSDGIKNDMAVITPTGVIGRVYKVFANSARVILISDVNSSIAVRFQGSRLEGIIQGANTGLQLKYIPQDTDAKLNDILITSGMDDIYPKGIPVGYITRIIKKGSGLFQYIEVTPFQNLSSIEHVVIVVPSLMAINRGR